MCSDASDASDSLTAIQLELRELALDAAAHSGTRPAMPMLGCRLLHWNPKLVDVRAEVVRDGERVKLSVYAPLDVRTGSRPHVFFVRVNKTKYGKPGQESTELGSLERQYGVTYRQFDPKSEVTRIYGAFKQCVTRAGKLVGALQKRLATVLPAETLAAKNDFHRWMFTTYDVAWQAPSGSPRSAVKYIPIHGFDASMHTDESVLYDLHHVRSTSWRKVNRRLDPMRRGGFSHFKEPYASWREELPQYYASRIDDILQASVWTIDWLVNQLADPT